MTVRAAQVDQGGASSGLIAGGKALMFLGAAGALAAVAFNCTGSGRSLHSWVIGLGCGSTVMLGAGGTLWLVGRRRCVEANQLHAEIDRQAALAQQAAPAVPQPEQPTAEEAEETQRQVAEARKQAAAAQRAKEKERAQRALLREAEEETAAIENHVGEQILYLEGRRTQLKTELTALAEELSQYAAHYRNAPAMRQLDERRRILEAFDAVLSRAIEALHRLERQAPSESDLLARVGFEVAERERLENGASMALAELGRCGPRIDVRMQQVTEGLQQSTQEEQAMALAREMQTLRETKARLDGIVKSLVPAPAKATVTAQAEPTAEAEPIEEEPPTVPAEPAPKVSEARPLFVFVAPPQNGERYESGILGALQALSLVDQTWRDTVFGGQPYDGLGRPIAVAVTKLQWQLPSDATDRTRAVHRAIQPVLQALGRPLKGETVAGFDVSIRALAGVNKVITYIDTTLRDRWPREDSRYIAHIEHLVFTRLRDVARQARDSLENGTASVLTLLPPLAARLEELRSYPEPASPTEAEAYVRDAVRTCLLNANRRLPEPTWLENRVINRAYSTLVTPRLEPVAKALADVQRIIGSKTAQQ
jgi:hypothetical protein